MFYDSRTCRGPQVVENMRTWQMGQLSIGRPLLRHYAACQHRKVFQTRHRIPSHRHPPLPATARLVRVGQCFLATLNGNIAPR